jgi:probable F420-dependent oxidoreductase
VRPADRSTDAIEFGVNFRTAASPAEFTSLVRRADELGFDVLAAPDHLGAPDPFVALSGAAMVTSRLRLRTYVLNAAFWNAALLAREVATLDLLSGGRVELGLGAGYNRSEFDDAELPWSRLEERVQVMERLLLEVRRRLADPSMQPKPVQPHVPVMVGAMSGLGLAVAARHADVVGFSGLRLVKGRLTLCSSEETAERVAEVKGLAAGRPYRSDVLLQRVVVDGDPQQAAAAFASEVGGEVNATEILDSPFVLMSPDPTQAVAELRRRKAVFGFDSVTTHQPSMEALGEVVAAFRAGG